MFLETAFFLALRAFLRLAAPFLGESATFAFPDGHTGLLSSFEHTRI